MKKEDNKSIFTTLITIYAIGVTIFFAMIRDVEDPSIRDYENTIENYREEMAILENEVDYLKEYINSLEDECKNLDAMYCEVRDQLEYYKKTSLPFIK